MASLAVPGEVENGMAVLMLHNAHAGAFQAGHVELPLASRMGIKARAYVPHGGVECPFGIGMTGQVPKNSLIFGGQHPALREHQLKDGIVRHVPPVDQFREHVLVHPEREDQGQQPYGFPDVRG
ncbi:MAG: hypothetical protein ACRDRE_16585 [Pseudonocardiaceae bacterium]